MQYKGSKRIRRVAAVILSAALMVSELPNTGLSYVVSATEDTKQESESQVENGSEPESSQQVESGSEPESSKQVESESEPESASQVETGGEPESSKQVESESEPESEAKNKNSVKVPVPKVDSSVYKYKTDDVEVLNENGISSLSSDYEIIEPLSANTDGTFSINSKDQFITFLADTSTYANKTVSLECDIDMKNSPITFSNTFSGKFDGKGHSISNVKMSEGMFKAIANGAEVKNLHISNAAIDGNSTIGVITPDNKGKISNCSVTGTLSVTKDMYSTAGIAGSNSGTISGCVFYGKINTVAGTEGVGKYVAGIAANNSGTISNCHVIGDIDSNAAVLAGIAASNSGTISNCSNYINVSGSYTIGGIASENTGTIKDCSNYGKISQKDINGVGQAGGIAAGNSASGTIQSCKNYAEIKGADNNIGGIAGYTAGTIKNCGNEGKVSGLSNVGGIAGLNNSTATAVISDCYNTGDISGSGAQGIGGILGSSADDAAAQIKNCYNTGSITVTSATKYIGGITGIIKKGTITGCYNTGKISGAAAQDAYAAMIAGFLADAVTCNQCLYLSSAGSVFGYKQGGPVTSDGCAKSETELKSDDVVTLLGDGFEKDTKAINNGYPVLKGQQASVKKYPVVYELNGGKSNDYFDLVQGGTEAPVKNAPVKKNATFEGWYTDKTLNSEFTTRTINAPVLLYAKWGNYTGAEKIELVNKNAKLAVGDTYQIQVKYTPENAKPVGLEWSSDKPEVATVDGTGTVKAIAAGDAKITVSSAELNTSLDFYVTVSADTNVIRFKDEQGNYIDRISIAVGENNAAKVTAEIGGQALPAGSTIQWSSSKEKYVKCEGNAAAIGINEAILTGVKSTKELAANEVTVTATVIYPSGSGKNSSCVGMLGVTVLPQASSINMMVGAENASDKYAFYDLYSKRFVSIGTSKDPAVGATKLTYPSERIDAVVMPADASQKVEWTSSDEAVMKVDKTTGALLGNAQGTAVITAKATDGSKMTGKVTVVTNIMANALSVEAVAADKTKPVAKDEYGRVILTSGNSVKLKPVFTPGDVTDSRVSWKISNKDAIEINGETKTATAKKVEEDTVVTVTCTARDGSAVSGEIQFIIKPLVEKIHIYKSDDMQHPVTDGKIGINPDKDSNVFTLKAKNLPENATQMVTWKSSDTNVAAIVDNKDGSCTVTVKKMGTSVITATATDGSKISAVTTVNVSSLASDISITGSNSVMKGKTITLKAEVYPKTTKNKKVVWSSLMPKIASVDKETGVVTGKAAGVAVIVATAADGSNIASSHTVTVTDAINSFHVIRYDGNSDPDDDEILSGKSVGLDPDRDKGEYRLDIQIKPETACRDVTWKSSDEKVATVEDGVIKAVGLGKAVVTVSATDGSGKKASVDVIVASLVSSIEVSGSHYVGEKCSIQLKATVGAADAKNKNVIWSSQYPSVAEVDQNGKVTAKEKVGSTVITAEAADGSGVKAEHIIYVTNKADKVTITSGDVDITEKSGKKSAKYDMSQRETITLGADCTGGSTGTEGIAKQLSWSSSDKNVATVKAVDSGDTATVTFIKAGTVTITATAKDGTGSKDSCTIKVSNTNPKVVITGPTQVAYKKKITLSTGATAVTWKSEDTSIATVNSKGQVTAKNKTGNVIITATAKEGGVVPNSDRYTVSVAQGVSNVCIKINHTKVPNKQKINVDLVKGYNGGQLDLDAEVTGDDDENVTWKSSNTDIATVDSEGKVTVKKAGTVKMTATAKDGSGKKAYIYVVIAKHIVDLKPKNDESEIRLGYGKSRQLSVSFTPISATAKKIVWSSEDKSVVSVSSTGVVKAKNYVDNSKGYITVTATAANDDRIRCEFKVYVSAPANKIEITKAGNTYASTIGLDLDTNESKISLNAKLMDKKGNVLTGQNVKWSSSDTKIAKVDQDGVVTGIAKGKVTITATARDGSKKTGKVTLYVGKLITGMTIDPEIANGFTLKKGSSKTISSKVTVTPFTATNRTLSYKSSNTKVVTINKDGKITAKGAGTAEITVKTTDGSSISKTFTVRVY